MLNEAVMIFYHGENYIMKTLYNGYIYLLDIVGSGYLKIGVSKNVKKRVLQINLDIKDKGYKAKEIFTLYTPYCFKIESDIKYKYNGDYMSLHENTEFIKGHDSKDIINDIITINNKLKEKYDVRYIKEYRVKPYNFKKNGYKIVKDGKDIAKFFHKKQLYTITNFNEDEIERLMSGYEIGGYSIFIV